MYGTIQFDDVEKLVAFLKQFVGCTATFTVREAMNGKFILTFDGGC